MGVGKCVAKYCEKWLERKVVEGKVVEIVEFWGNFGEDYEEGKFG